MPGASDANSTDFKIENASIKADCLVLDSAMDNTIAEALLQGKPLSLSIASWSNQYFQLANLPADRASWNVVLSRSFSRLNSLFINFLPDMATVTAGVWTESNLFSCWHGGTPFNAAPGPPGIQQGSRYVSILRVCWLSGLADRADGVARGGVLPDAEMHRAASE